MKNNSPHFSFVVFSFNLISPTVIQIKTPQNIENAVMVQSNKGILMLSELKTISVISPRLLGIRNIYGVQGMGEMICNITVAINKSASQIYKITLNNDIFLRSATFTYPSI